MDELPTILNCTPIIHSTQAFSNIFLVTFGRISENAENGLLLFSDDNKVVVGKVVVNQRDKLFDGISVIVVITCAGYIAVYVFQLAVFLGFLDSAVQAHRYRFIAYARD